jgi:nucleotide-binding universal stress UspA family protein
VNAALDQEAGLIVMSTFGSGEFYRYLLGSVTAKVLHETPCPVWTGAHLEDPPAREFAVRNILCSVDLNAHSRHTITLAAEMARSLEAQLTLVHVTSSVESWGPGGTYIDQNWKEKLVGIATKEISELQQESGTKAEVIIESGNVVENLKRAIEKTSADVLVIGHTLGRSHLGDNSNGYGIITESPIPVLSV